MTREELFENIKKTQSFLCVGLDTDATKIPEYLFNNCNSSDYDPILFFNKEIIDATADLCVAYKPNIAFYECTLCIIIKKKKKIRPKEIFSINFTGMNF